MKTVNSWTEGLDVVDKIGWPFHGLLEQISATQYRLSAPGAVLTFNAGDLSHAIAYPISLTGAASWRTGLCQRYQIPGLPMPTTTQDEADLGMTWLNYFIQSGIAHFGTGYRALVDEAGKPWRAVLKHVGNRPSSLEIWGNVAGVFGKKMDIAIPDPGFVYSIATLAKLGITCSSSGRVIVCNYFDYEGDTAKRTALITITGSVYNGTLAAACTKLVDSDISGLSGVEGSSTSTNTGTFSAHMDFKLQYADMGSQGWGPWIDEGSVTTQSWVGTFGPSTVDNIISAALPGTSPPTAPPTTATRTWRWISIPATYDDTRSGDSVATFSTFSCLGYFVGHDDTVQRVDRRYKRYSYGTQYKPYGTQDAQLHATITYSDYADIGSRSSAAISDYDEFSGVNTTTQTRVAGARGVVVNLLAHGHRAVAVAASVVGAPNIYTYSYACGQVGDAPLFPMALSTAAIHPDPPNFSVHPVNGQIAARPADGYPISWV